MKQTTRNLCVFGTFALTSLAASGGCSSDPETPLGGFGGTSTGGTAAQAGTTTTAGTGTSGTGFGTAGTGTGTAGTGTGTAGTFGAAGTFGSGGTFGTAGTDTGGTAGAGGSAGAGGTAAGTGGGGTSAGGTGGAPAGDFPANCPAPTGAHGAALTRSCWALTASDCAKTAQNMNPPLQAIDAAGITTRFATGALMSTSKAFTFQIDLGTPVMVNGVQVVSGGTKVPMDFAPQLEVGVSMDGTTFTPVACGDGALTTEFSFTAVNARYVRLVQHGISDAWWSIHDLNVYAASGATCASGGTPTETCTLPHTQ